MQKENLVYCTLNIGESQTLKLEGNSGPPNSTCCQSNVPIWILLRICLAGTHPKLKYPWWPFQRQPTLAFRQLQLLETATSNDNLPPRNFPLKAIQTQSKFLYSTHTHSQKLILASVWHALSILPRSQLPATVLCQTDPLRNRKLPFSSLHPQCWAQGLKHSSAKCISMIPLDGK